MISLFNFRTMFNLKRTPSSVFSRGTVPNLGMNTTIALLIRLTTSNVINSIADVPIGLRLGPGGAKLLLLQALTIPLALN